MSINKKIMMSMVCAVVTSTVLAMEIELKKSQNININNGSSSEQPYSSYLNLSNFSAGFNHVSDYVASSLDSLSNTITNQISDEAAFKKLGWPLTDEVAQQELKRSLELYKRHTENFKFYNQYSKYADDCNAINRRTQYCQRVLYALYGNTIVNCADRPKIALHCLQHHKSVLNKFDQSKFLYFVKLYQDRIKEDTAIVDQKLNNLTIVSKEDEELNMLLAQTIKQQQDAEQKKLEQQKKLEEQKRFQEQKNLEEQRELEEQKKLEEEQKKQEAQNALAEAQKQALVEIESQKQLKMQQQKQLELQKTQNNKK